MLFISGGRAGCALHCQLCLDLTGSVPGPLPLCLVFLSHVPLKTGHGSPFRFLLFGFHEVSGGEDTQAKSSTSASSTESPL